MAGAVDEVFSIARVLDDLARGVIEGAQRKAGAHGGAARGVGGADEVVDALLLVRRSAEEDGARHVARVGLPAQPYVDDDRVARAQRGRAVGDVMRFGAVRAEADQRLEARAGRALGFCGGEIGRGDVGFGFSGAERRNRRSRRPVVFRGAFAQKLQLFRVLAHARVVHARGAEHGTDIAARFHQADGELAGPEFIDADFAGAHRRGEQLRRIVRVVELNQRHVHAAGQREQAVGVQRRAAVRGNVKRQHALAGRNPCAGQIEHRGGRGNDNLFQPPFFHSGDHAGKPFFFHL